MSFASNHFAQHAGPDPVPLREEIARLRAELAHIRDATKVGSMSWNFDQLGVAYEQLEARLAEQMADRADLESVIEVQTGRLCTALAERDAARAELDDEQESHSITREELRAVKAGP